MKLLNIVLVSAILSLASSAFAGMLFFDDFERGDLVGLEAITNNQPAVGVWTVTGDDLDYGYKGDWHPAANGIPDSYVFGGQKFALTIRSGNNITAGEYTNVNATFAAQNNASEVLRFETDFYGQNAGSTPADLKLAMLSGDTELNAVTLSGGAAAGSVLVGGVDTGLTYSVGGWHHLTMDYVPGSSTFSLAIDGQTPLAGLATTPSAVDGLRFVQTSVGQDRWSVWDNVSVTSSAVPEPSCIVLLSVGVFGLMAYAWRKRR